MALETQTVNVPGEATSSAPLVSPRTPAARPWLVRSRRSSSRRKRLSETAGSKPAPRKRLRLIQSSVGLGAVPLIVMVPCSRHCPAGRWFAHLNGEVEFPSPLGPRPCRAQRRVGVASRHRTVVFQRRADSGGLLRSVPAVLCGSDVGDAVADGESRNGVADQAWSESVEAFFATLSSILPNLAARRQERQRDQRESGGGEDQWLLHRTSMAQRDALPGHGPTTCRALAT